jgi:hypothetical protein
MSSYSQHSDLIFRCSLSLPCQLAAKWTTCMAGSTPPHRTSPASRVHGCTWRPSCDSALRGPSLSVRWGWLLLPRRRRPPVDLNGSPRLPFFFSLLSILYAMIINTPIYYILCAMPVLFRDGKMHANAMDNWTWTWCWRLAMQSRTFTTSRNFPDALCAPFILLYLYTYSVLKKKQLYVWGAWKKIKLYQIYKNNINIYISRYITL